MSRIGDWIDRLAGQTLVVFGDIMLDRFTYGDSTRISPEAPAPVFRADRVEEMVGGAGNVARNIASLGGEAILIGAIGEDAPGDALLAAAAATEKLETRLIRTRGSRTSVKNRYVAKNQQMLRVDEEDIAPPADTVLDAILDTLETALGDGAAALVLSDYAKGMLSDNAIERSCALATKYGVPVIVDPKSRDLSRYRGASVITPNAKEAEEASGISASSDAGAAEAAKALAEQSGAPIIVLTRGAQGMSVRDKDGSIRHYPTAAQEVFDVSGAGDTVVAALALGLAAKAPTEIAVELANRAAGVVVGKLGTATVSAAELHIACHGGGPDGRMISDFEGARKACRAWQDQGLDVVFTNGCFDLIHPGHISLLSFAKSQGDKLIVAINSDASVKRLKGPTRPVQDEASRATVMEALRDVDLVVIFDEDTPLECITAIQPDVVVKGADYSEDEVVGGDIVKARGGRVALAPLIDGQSTTAAIARANASEQADV